LKILTRNALIEEESMLKKHFVIIGILAALLFSACGTRSNLFQRDFMLEKNWGRSYETAKYNQILNPDAGKNLDPVIGLDGQASDFNMEKYKSGFKETEGAEVTNILKLQ
jgi:hypothetical protein